MRRANVLIVILLASFALVLLACGKDEATIGSGTETTPGTPADTATQTQTTTTATTSKTVEVVPRTSDDGCDPVAQPQPLAAPERRRSKIQLSPNRIWVATIKTNCGTIKLRLAVGR